VISLNSFEKGLSYLSESRESLVVLMPDSVPKPGGMGCEDTHGG
jgi:hypothetical protein